MHTNRNEELVFQQYCFYILTLNYLRVTTLLKIDQLTEALKSPKNASSAILGQNIISSVSSPKYSPKSHPFWQVNPTKRQWQWQRQRQWQWQRASSLSPQYFPNREGNDSVRLVTQKNKDNEKYNDNDNDNDIDNDKDNDKDNFNDKYNDKDNDKDNDNDNDNHFNIPHK